MHDCYTVMIFQIWSGRTRVLVSFWLDASSGGRWILTGRSWRHKQTDPNQQSPYSRKTRTDSAISSRQDYTHPSQFRNRIVGWWHCNDAEVCLSYVCKNTESSFAIWSCYLWILKFHMLWNLWRFILPWINLVSLLINHVDFLFQKKTEWSVLRFEGCFHIHGCSTQRLPYFQWIPEAFNQLQLCPWWRSVLWLLTEVIW